MTNRSSFSQDIKGISLSDLQDYFQKKNQPAFRAQQIFAGIYQQKKKDFDQISSLPVALREQLMKDFVCAWPVLDKEQIAKDGTRKFLFRVSEKDRIETVFIPTEKRGTVCLSTQVGCKFGCAFCASGVGGWQRHLTCAEIISQLLCVQERVAPKSVTHVVFMGIGEPLDNYDNVIAALKLINEKKGLNIASRRITISTCGLIPEIKRFAQEHTQVELAISLHAANDALRSQLMPVNKKYPLKELLACCHWYTKTTNRQITFEYILLKDINSRIQDAQELSGLLKGLLCKINLIVYNANDSFSFLPPSPREVSAFQACLERNGVLFTLRASRGQEIQGACGQLRLL